MDNRAETRPTMSKDISVTVAMVTPTMIGIKLKYTSCGCLSPNSTLVNMTVNKGIVAFTAVEEKELLLHYTTPLDKKVTCVRVRNWHFPKGNV